MQTLVEFITIYWPPLALALSATISVDEILMISTDRLVSEELKKFFYENGMNCVIRVVNVEGRNP